MPITFEAVFKKRSFARTKDVERSITITLAAGKATITEAVCFNYPDRTIVTKAYPGSKIGFFITIRNDGDRDIIWHTGKDKDTGILLKTTDGMPLEYVSDLNSGMSSRYQHEWFIMPNKNLNVLIEAGHGSA